MADLLSPSEVYDFAPAKSEKARREFRTRSKTEITIKMDFDVKEERENLELEGIEDPYITDSKNTTIIERKNYYEIRRKKPLWERLEDDVWRLFYSLEATQLPIGWTRLSYRKPRRKDGRDGLAQLDGLYADDFNVYLVECKWTQQKGGERVRGHRLRDSVLALQQRQSGLAKRITSIDGFEGKPLHVLFITQGYDTSSIQNEAKDNFHFLDSQQVRETLKLAGTIKRAAAPIFRQELFHGRKIPGEPVSLDAVTASVDRVQMYSLFAKASELIDRVHVPRKQASAEQATKLYQRAIKASKIRDIGSYLERTGNFFPNSVILAGNNLTLTKGRLRLPNHYGALWVLDGQHRLYGAAASSDPRPLPVVILTECDEIQQARLFRIINEKHTKIPAELLWDIVGDEPFEREPNLDEEWEVKEARRRSVAQLWKSLNTKRGSPLKGMIVVPSQTDKSGECFVKLGFLCRELDQQDIWEEGRLRKRSWVNASDDAYIPIRSFFQGLKTASPGEWEKPSGSALFDQYSLTVILMILRRGITYLSGGAYSTRWKRNPTELMKIFAKDLVSAMDSGRPRFLNAAKRAANGKLRRDLAKKMLRRLETKYPGIAA